MQPQKDVFVPLKPGLSDEQRSILFAGLLLRQGLYERTHASLSAADIDVIRDAAYLCIWRGADEINKRTGGLPTDPAALRLLLEAEAYKVAQGDPELVRPHHTAQLASWFTRWFAPDVTLPEEEYVLSLFKDYLVERQLCAPMQQYAQRLHMGLPTDLHEFLDNISSTQTRVEGVGQSAVMEVFPEGLVRKPAEIYSTGINFIDNLMAGGQADGEVYVILGATGSGKSTLAVQIAVNGAQRERRRRQEGLPARYWYYACYEMPVEPDTRDRVLSCAGGIDHQTLKDMTCEADAATMLSSCARGDYRTYEKDVFRDLMIDEAGPPPGEYERWAAAKAAVGSKDSHLRLLEYSGAIPGKGIGGVAELAADLAASAAAGYPPAGVIVDYAGLACDRYVAERNLPAQDTYLHMRRFVDQVRTKICTRFNCCAWVVHQLGGAMGAKKPGVVSHSSDAVGCRNFADNAWFSFEVGTVCTTTRCAVINRSKSRRAPPMPPAVAILQGNVRRWTSAEGKYVLDNDTKTFVESHLADKVAGGVKVYGPKPVNIADDGLGDY